MVLNPVGIRHRERPTQNCKTISLKILQDGSSINVARIKWFQKEDLLAFDIAKSSFARKRHGKKPVQHQNIIPFKLTRGNCVSKAASQESQDRPQLG